MWRCCWRMRLGYEKVGSKVKRLASLLLVFFLSPFLFSLFSFFSTVLGILLAGFYFSRKHGEGFFRWVHLSCSHESHYKVSLQARSHCKESLQGVIARSHCKESLQGGKESLHLTPWTPSLATWSHCKDLQLALNSVHLRLAQGDSLQ